MTDQIIQKYNLRKHPEGGYYRETYRSYSIVESGKSCGPRSAVTDIYFLLPAGEISRFHKVLHDEIWHFYEGAPLKIITFDNNKLSEHIIGRDMPDGYKFVVAGGIWQAAVSTGDYSLVGCTVAPGFDFADFAFLANAMDSAKKLKHCFPAHTYLL